MPIQERLLGLVGVAETERLPGCDNRRAKHVQLRRLPGDRGDELTEINLGLNRRQRESAAPSPVTGGTISTRNEPPVPHRGLADGHPPG
jgi:hypothetical protein